MSSLLAIYPEDATHAGEPTGLIPKTKSSIFLNTEYWKTSIPVGYKLGAETEHL
jgi:hypothetical protein